MKTDRNDARALAFYLSKDMLPETRPKTRAESELASLTHTRDLLVKQRTRLLNKIHALHNRHGIKLKKESLSSKRRLMALDIGRFSALEQVELKVVRDQALSLTASIAELDREIERAAGAMDGYDSLVSIKGIGPRAAAVFLSGIGDVNDFESADKLAAYLGIVPRVSQSNETDNRGRITKRGNKLVRTTLVQCTLIAIRYSGYLNAFYRRIKERRGAGKAIIATARKLLKIIYDTLKTAGSSKTSPPSKSRENQSPLDNHHRRRGMTGDGASKKRVMAGRQTRPSTCAADLQGVITGSSPVMTTCGLTAHQLLLSTSVPLWLISWMPRTAAGHDDSGDFGGVAKHHPL